jgi:hypothetical protein
MSYVLLIVLSLVSSSALASDLIKKDLEKLCSLSQEALPKITADPVKGVS